MTQSPWLRQTSGPFASDADGRGAADSGAIDDAAPTEATAKAWVFTGAARYGVTGVRSLTASSVTAGDFAYAAAVRPANGAAEARAGWLSAASPPSGGFSFNLATGQNASGGIQTTGDLADAHWTVSNSDNYKQAPIAFTVAPGDADWFPGTGQNNPGWFANGPNSCWIAADPDNADNGRVTYTITFDLTGYNPADATLMGGQFSIDDQGVVLLNGHQIGGVGGGAWTTFHALSNGAGDFVAGLNTIVIQTTASDGFLEAARFEGTVVDNVTTNPPGPIHWASAVSGDFTTATDWTGGLVPSSNNDAILDAPGATDYTVTSGTGETVNSVQTAATATLAITGGTFAATAGTGSGANAGAIDVGAGANLSIGGKFANSGVIALAGGLLTVAQSATLSGAGALTLSDVAANEVAGGASAVTLTNLNNTIAGAGTLGSATLTLVNAARGTIDATGANALILATGANTIANAGLIEATGTGGLTIDSAVANTGALRAVGSGALTINGAAVDNTGGVVTVSAGGHLVLNSGSIGGGTLAVAAGAALSVANLGNSLTAATFTNSGTVNIEDHAVLDVGGSIINRGTIALQSANIATFLIIAEDTTLSGGGQVTLTNLTANRIFGGASAVTLTNLNNTIAGSGVIGGDTLTLVNGAAGVIDASGAAGLFLDGVTDNAGLIEATGAGGLTIGFGGSVDGSAGGTLLAANGSEVFVRGATLIGGTLESEGSGFFRVRKHIVTNTFDGTASALTNAATVRVGSGAALTLEGAIDNTGRIQLRSIGAGTTLTIGAAGATLSGGGRLTMDDKISNHIVGATPSATLTNVDDIIMGGGTLGGGTMTLVNEAAGVINGHYAVGLTIDTGANAVVNAGLIEATKGGALTVDSALDNTGTLLAVGGGTLTLVGDVSGAGTARIHGGTLDADGAFSEDVAFAGGSGALGLAQAQSYAGTISGFSRRGATSLDLGDIAFVGSGEATWSGGVLTVTDGTHTATITLAGNYGHQSFVASDDGHGGTLVIATTPGPQATAAAPAHRFAAAMAATGAHAAMATASSAEIHPTAHALLTAPRLRYA